MPAPEGQLSAEKCQACGEALWDMGVQDFAEGNVPSPARELTPWGEGLAPERLALQFYVCSKCRRVELRVPEDGFRS